MIRKVKKLWKIQIDLMVKKILLNNNLKKKVMKKIINDNNNLNNINILIKKTDIYIFIFFNSFIIFILIHIKYILKYLVNKII